MELGKIFKKKLEQQEFDVSKDYWESMEKRLDKAMPVNKKRSRFLFLLFPVFGFLGYYFYPLSNSTQTFMASRYTGSKSLIKSDQNSQRNIIIKNTNNETKIKEENKSFTQDENKSHLKEELKIKTNSKTVMHFGSSNLFDAEHTKGNTKLNPPKLVGTNSKKVNLKMEEIFVPSKISRVNLEKDNLAASIPLSNKLTKEESISPDKKVLENTNLNSSINHDSLSEISAKKSNFQLESIIALNPEQITNEAREGAVPFVETTLVNDKSIKGKDESLVLPTKSKIKFSTSIYGGAMYTGKKISDNRNVNAEYLTRRKAEEKNVLNYNLGLDANFEFKNWIFTSGINYHQQGEERNYSNKFYRDINVEDPYWEKINRNVWEQHSHSFTTTEVITLVTNRVDTVYYFDVASGSYTSAYVNSQNLSVVGIQTTNHTILDSTYVTIIDSVQKTKTITKVAYVADTNQLNLKGKNSISYIEVPILIGYQFKFNKLNFALKSGIGFGILRNTKTYYLSNDVATISQVKTENYNKVVYNYLIRISAMYNFYKNWGLVFEPNFRANLNKVTNMSSGFNQKYWNVGGNIGVNYRF